MRHLSKQHVAHMRGSARDLCAVEVTFHRLAREPEKRQVDAVVDTAVYLKRDQDVLLQPCERNRPV
jgi:hypothetical protein